jgi:ribonuclease D
VSRRTSDHPLAYLDTADAVDRFVDSISETRELALDTEGASFHRYVDRIYLLQLSTRDRSAIIDPLPIGTPAGLGALLEASDVEVVLHDADYDLRLLEQDYGWHVRRIFDTRVAAQLLGLRAFGLAALLERYFGVKLDKKHQRADWSMRPLTQGMLEYAAQDTRYLLDLRNELAAALRNAGRWAWAEEEFTRLEGTKWEREDESQAFLRVKGARDLTRRELAVLRELVPWRDAVARQVDRATFRVVSNDVLLEASRRQPATREELTGIRGMPRNMNDARIAELLDAVRRGKAVSEADLPRFPRAPRWDRDPDFDDRVARLKAVRDEVAARLDLDPGVLCARDRLEAVARKRPKTPAELAEVSELRAWQRDVLGDAFIAAMGQASARPSASRPAPSGAAKDDSPYSDA